MKNALAALLLRYFRFLARLQLKKIHPVIVGITGSAGKTSTLHAVHAVLQDFTPTKVSFKANSESGIPLDILGLHVERYTVLEWLWLAVRAPLQLLLNWRRYSTYIVEMGIDSPHPPKNMRYLLTIVQPDVGVFLNARAVHAENFDGVIGTPKNAADRLQKVTRAIAAEKGNIITSLPPTGTAVLNCDDPLVRAFTSQTAATPVLFGQGTDATVQLTSVEQSLRGTTCHFRYGELAVHATFPEYLLPNHLGYSLAAALAVGLHFGISPREACEALEKHFHLPPGRASLIPGINHSLILDSSYNASPEPVIDLLKLSRKLAPCRAIALLGDIRELGEVTQLEHERVAQIAAECCESVVLVGPLMQQYALPVLERAKTPVHWFATASEAAEFLQATLKPKDLLLVKGSQNTILLEIAVEALMAHPENADRDLCRRGVYWDARRATLRPPAHK